LECLGVCCRHQSHCDDQAEHVASERVRAFCVSILTPYPKFGLQNEIRNFIEFPLRARNFSLLKIDRTGAGSAQLPDQWVPSSGEVKNVRICTALFHTPSWRRRKNCIFYVIEIETNCLGNSNQQHQLTVLLTNCNRPVIIMIRHHDTGQLRDMSDVECSRYCA